MYLSGFPTYYVIKYVFDFIPVSWLTSKIFGIFTIINVLLYADGFRREAFHREKQGRIRVSPVALVSIELTTNSQ